MNRIAIAVCDDDEAYARRLGAWFSMESREQFVGYSFSKTEAFRNMYRTGSFDVVLLGGGFQKELWIQEEICRENGPENVLWMYLEEGGLTKAAVQEQEEQRRAPEEKRESSNSPSVRIGTREQGTPGRNRIIPVLEKYQQIPAMARQIFYCWEEYHSCNALAWGGAKEVIAWYAPAGSSLQTPLAMTMASALGEREKVLYVNFWESAGFSHWFMEEYQRDILDVMYLSGDEASGSWAGLKSTVYTMEGFDYIPPATEGQLLGEIEKKEYLEFLDFLTGHSDYDVILLDFGKMIPGFFELLEQCKRVYVLTEHGILKEGAAEHFREQINQKEALAKKVIWLDLPNINSSALAPGCLMQQWIFGEIGDYIRGILEGKFGRT